jgi:hypothetical protein
VFFSAASAGSLTSIPSDPKPFSDMKWFYDLDVSHQWSSIFTVEHQQKMVNNFKITSTISLILPLIGFFLPSLW